MAVFYKNQQPLGWTNSGVVNDDQRAYDVHFDERYAEYDVDPGSPKQLIPGQNPPEFYQAIGKYGLCDLWPITVPTSGSFTMTMTKFHQVGNVQILHQGELVYEYETPKTLYNRNLNDLTIYSDYLTNPASGDFDILIQLNGRRSSEYAFFIGFDD